MSVPQDKLMELMGGPRSAGAPPPVLPTSAGMGSAPPDAETPPLWVRPCPHLNPRWGQNKQQ